MRIVKKMLREMEHTRMGTSSFDLQGVIKVGESRKIVLQRQSLSQGSGGRRSVFNDDLFAPHQHPKLHIYQGFGNPNDLRRVNKKNRKSGVSEYEVV